MNWNSISVFDLDHTLLNVNCSFALGKYLSKIGCLSLKNIGFNAGCYALHTAGFFSLQQLHEKIFSRSFYKQAQQDYIRWAGEFLDLSLNKLVYLPALQKLREAKEKGHYTLILSSSPDFIVAQIAARLEVDAFQATEYLVDKHGFFNNISTIMDGSYKAAILKETAKKFELPLSKTIAYSDSHLDLPLLEIAGKAVGVNPNRKLKSICLKRFWEIV